MAKINKLEDIINNTVPKLFVLNSSRVKQHLPTAMARRYGKTANCRQVTYDELPKYLAKYDIRKKGLTEPDDNEYGALLYKAAEEVLNKASYYKDYRNKPALFRQVGEVILELLEAGVEDSVFKKLDNKAKWNDIILLKNKIIELYKQNKFIGVPCLLREGKPL